MNKLAMLQGYLFLAHWFSIGAIGEINIIQSPPYISATEGESVQMNCSWKTHEKIEQMRVEWWKNQSLIISLLYQQNSSDTRGKNASYTLVIKANNTCAELRIANLTSNHTGTYYCRAQVEIPRLIRGNGSGTVLCVHEVKSNSSLGSGTVVGVVLAVLFVLIIIALLWNWKILMSKGEARDEGDTAAVYESILEMKAMKEPQEPQDIESNSSSSRGSTQWAEIEVYESCDYVAVKRNE
ncbi:hypothetical protein HHUSO_G177 [Huso huso]|uniref:Ig-like domain-containing protein n=1 Tax=Huso huso TaxID=61971 RepID=A0ABR1AAA3_HUSHU